MHYEEAYGKCNGVNTLDGQIDRLQREIQREKEDLVNHPNHYKTNNGLETITVIEAFTDGLIGIEATDTGNILKYMCRWKKKNGLQDLKKAQWYLNHLIRHMEIEESKNEKENN